MRNITGSLIEEYKSDCSSDDERPSSNVKARQRAIEAEVAERSANDRAKLKEKDIKEQERDAEREKLRFKAITTFSGSDIAEEIRLVAVEFSALRHRSAVAQNKRIPTSYLFDDLLAMQLIDIRLEHSKWIYSYQRTHSFSPFFTSPSPHFPLEHALYLFIFFTSFRRREDNDVEDVPRRSTRRHSYDPDSTDSPSSSWRVISEEAEEKHSVMGMSINSSGNNLSDVAPGRMRPQESKGTSSSTSISSSNFNTYNNNSGNGSGTTSPLPISSNNINSKTDASYLQQEHRDDMTIRRKEWQAEIDFHDASVARQRIAMSKEKEQMAIEREALRLMKISVASNAAIVGSSGTNNDINSSNNVISDLRLKLKELEGERTEMKNKNSYLEEQLTAVKKTMLKEKEVG